MRRRGTCWPVSGRQSPSRTGVPASTLRFYESEGLLPADRAENGYRVYGEAAVDRLAFIAQAKHLDLPLPAVRELVDGPREERAGTDGAPGDPCTRGGRDRLRCRVRVRAPRRTGGVRQQARQGGSGGRGPASGHHDGARAPGPSESEWAHRHKERAHALRTSRDSWHLDT
ncbi:MerR family transcriptional regulator [Cellulosimicrobium cellulans]|uniref:MerR family transcriptional regulator n=1 Tax=Cellulosimicrobium cellulans TaxID=1710 RepID=UPI0018832654|nr:MerR family transcriptional regulator [Cellulosimicrobium cellulans]MBE9924285.1 MerR family transcriptional regulator [Cellulosimicrobium cellulans]